MKKHHNHGSRGQAHLTPFQAGTIQTYNPDTGYGTLIARGGWKEISFSISDAIQNALVDTDEPEKVNHKVRWRIRTGDRVLFLLKKASRVSCWTMKEWIPETQPAPRPRDDGKQFRITRKNILNGVQTSTETIFEGTRAQMMETSRRRGHKISSMDIFAPVYVRGPFVAKHVFEENIGSAGALARWVLCEDPRPFPKGEMFRIMHSKDGRIKELARGTAEVLEWKFSTGSALDPLAHSPNKESDLIYFERFSGLDAGKEVWLETQDPRQSVVKLLAKMPAPSTNQQAQASTESAKAAPSGGGRHMKTIATSFAGLAQAFN